MRRGLLVGLLVIAAWVLRVEGRTPSQGQQLSPTRRTNGVEHVASKYDVAPGGLKGSFVTGQDADLMLGGFGFNDSGGPLSLNHPTGLATDGTRLLVSDRWNNRVLIWKKLPTGNTPPDLVLGQKDFKTNQPGRGLNELSWPGNVAITPDGQRIIVADTNNDRILLWNSFPKANGEAAAVTIDLRQLSSPGARMRLGWPWGVWTDGKKLAVVCTHGGCLLIWNDLPARDNETPDLTLTPSGCGTPRNVTSDGTRLMLSDHNNGSESRPATMVWRSWPTSPTQEPDYVWREWMKGTITQDRRLILAGMQSIFLWDSVPQLATDYPALTVRPHNYRNGDGPDVVVAGGRMYACNYNGCNILGWNRVPTADDQQPDFVIGARDTGANPWEQNFFIQNPIPATNGKSLFVTSDFDRKMFIWKYLPDTSAARPDLVYHLPEGAWDNAMHGDTLVLAGRRSVTAWRKPPLNGEPPEVKIDGGIGSTAFLELTGVALDDKHLYLSDRGADCIYVWDASVLHPTNQQTNKPANQPTNKPTTDFSPPKFTVRFHRPGRLSSDGTYLAVSPFEGSSVALYRIADLASGEPLITSRPGTFNLPGKCLVAHGALIVANTSFNRVEVWHRIADALGGQPADALLGTDDLGDTTPEIGRNKLFMPAGLAFDGSYLWVGEFKFSTRVLRFSVR